MRADIKSAIGTAMVLALLASSTLQAGQFPSRPRQGVIVDETSTLSRQTILEINRISTKIKNATNGEIMVAIIQSTGGKQHRQFATELFNYWKIGDRAKDNGVLVFVAMQDRKAEIILGDGIDEPAEVKSAAAIMSDYMMPQFKKGRPEAGVLAAVRESGRRFFSVEPQKATPSHVVDASSSSSDHSIASSTSSAEFPDAVFPEGGVTGDADLVRPAVANHDHHANEQAAHGSFVPPNNMQRRRRGAGRVRLLTVLFGGGVTLTGAGIGWRIFGRNRARICELCKFPMVKLSEVQDDAHLDASEQIEERIGSVDYDVWSCTACDHVVKSRYAALFTRYAKCPQCRGRTKSSTTSTIRAATTSSSGLKEVTETCANCNYRRVSKQQIPMVVRSNHSSSSNFSSGGGFSGGGGSSSGGGASGSW